MFNNIFTRHQIFKKKQHQEMKSKNKIITDIQEKLNPFKNNRFM